MPYEVKENMCVVVTHNGQKKTLGQQWAEFKCSAGVRDVECRYFGRSTKPYCRYAVLDGGTVRCGCRAAAENRAASAVVMIGEALKGQTFKEDA